MIDFKKLFKLKAEDLHYRKVLIVLWTITIVLFIFEEILFRDLFKGFKLSGSFLFMTMILSCMALIKFLKSRKN